MVYCTGVIIELPNIFMIPWLVFLFLFRCFSLFPGCSVSSCLRLLTLMRGLGSSFEVIEDMFFFAIVKSDQMLTLDLRDIGFLTVAKWDIGLAIRISCGITEN